MHELFIVQFILQSHKPILYACGILSSYADTH